MTNEQIDRGIKIAKMYDEEKAEWRMDVFIHILEAMREPEKGYTLVDCPYYGGNDGNDGYYVTPDKPVPVKEVFDEVRAEHKHTRNKTKKDLDITLSDCVTGPRESDYDYDKLDKLCEEQKGQEKKKVKVEIAECGQDWLGRSGVLKMLDVMRHQDRAMRNQLIEEAIAKLTIKPPTFTNCTLWENLAYKEQ